MMPKPDWSVFGSSASSSGVAWEFERDAANEGRFRITYTERGKPTVRHTFDMRERLAKRMAATLQEGN